MVDDDKPGARATIARGLALVAVLAVLLTAGMAITLPWHDGRLPPEPACLRPIEVIVGMQSRLGCSLEPVLKSCGALEAGDRVYIHDCGCERLAGGMNGAIRLLVGLPLDLNRAEASELELLDGVGPRLAAAIISDREAHGPFPSLEALDRVPGIGPVTVDKLRPFLSAAAPLPR
jgi:competence ComEA-like helix-hairpin-helix protein